MIQEFKPGDLVFNIHGQQASYIGRCSAGHIVEPQYHGDEEEPCFGQPTTWAQVFLKPPTEVLHAEIAALDDEIQQRQQELRKIEQEARASRYQVAEAMARYKMVPGLADLDLWLSGKATHLVEINPYSLRVGTVKEILDRKERHETSVRLLSIYGGDTENRYNMRWKMAAYSDGSGNTTPILLATSLEHAIRLAKGHIEALMKHGDACNRVNEFIGMWDSLIPHGVTPPADIAAAIEARKKAAHQCALDQARKTLAHYQAQVAALEAQP